MALSNDVSLIPAVCLLKLEIFFLASHFNIQLKLEYTFQDSIKVVIQVIDNNLQH